MGLVLEKVGGSLLSLCLPKDTSSLEGVLLTPTGLLVEMCMRPRGEVTFSDPAPQLADLRMIFMVLRSLNPPGEEEGVCGVTEGEPTSPPFTPLLLFSDVQWKADLRRATAAPPVTAAEVL